MEKISIIVPCYNEEEAMPIFYEEICKVTKKMKKVDFEFIFVNDGSKDKTKDIIEEIAKSDTRVVLLNQYNQVNFQIQKHYLLKSTSLFYINYMYLYYIIEILLISFSYITSFKIK